MNADLHRTDASLPIALIRAREVLMGPIREMLAASGLTEQQWRVLRVLDEDGPSDARSVARAAAVSAPSLSRILTGLEARGLVTRQGDRTDRRRQVVEVSETGRQMIEANIRQARALAEATRARLGTHRHATLLALLGEISGWRDRP